MKLKLSKSIAELEAENIKHIWEPPDIYDDVHNNDVWLIYGRKGAGKSTVIDYLGAENATPNVIIVRPRQTTLFAKILTSISQAKDEERIIEQTTVAAIDFALTVLILEELVPTTGIIKLGSAREKIYNFLTTNKLGGGGSLRKTIKFISSAIGNTFELLPNLSTALEKATGDVSLDEVKEALCKFLIEEQKKFVLCIDDIDEIGFTYSRSDRVFINALIVFMVRSNLYFLDKKVKGRVLLTSPSELFFQSSLWGSDWVSSKSKCLIWSDLSHLQELVNKRIAVELGVRKKHPRFQGDKFSIETDQTWRRIFPMTIWNKRGKQESAFEYIVRHTFYTPRQILDLCDSILHDSEALLKHPDPGADALSPEWSRIFQETVGNFAQRVERDVRTLFSAIYDNLDETLKNFIGRPNAWNRNQLTAFVTNKQMKLVRKHDMKVITGEDLLFELQQIGFLGLGTRSLDPAPVGVEAYTMYFSFLEDYPSRKAWEIAAITPLFYDAYDIRAVDALIVKPHEKLFLTATILRNLRTYDPERNTFID